MRIASHGHASTHRPHTTQRSSSISNTAGFFSMPLLSVSAGMIVMQCAGHTVGQHMHATQRTAPSSRSMRRWRPRNRSGYVTFSSGYWTVSISFFHFSSTGAPAFARAEWQVVQLEGVASESVIVEGWVPGNLKSSRVEGTGRHDIALELDREPDAPGAYPVVLVSYHIYCSSYGDPEVLELAKEFGHYVVSEEGQQASSEAVKSAPLPENLTAEAQAALDSITLR